MFFFFMPENVFVRRYVGIYLQFMKAIKILQEHPTSWENVKRADRKIEITDPAICI